MRWIIAGSFLSFDAHRIQDIARFPGDQPDAAVKAAQRFPVRPDLSLPAVAADGIAAAVKHGFVFISFPASQAEPHPPQMGMNTIAEGVETREQIEILKKYGCLRGQGYFFDKPLTKDEFEKVLGNPDYSSRG